MMLFTADQHWGHANIVEYCDRPFDNVDQMDEELVEQWNGVVRRDRGDIVYHLGDFTLGGPKMANQYFGLLNGTVRMVSTKFHHDKRWLCQMGYRTRSDWVVKVMDAVVLLSSPLTVLSHTPMARWYRQHYGAWHLHAHCHGRYQGEGLMLDVGVDSAHKLLGAYRPFSLDEVRQIMEAKNV
jgi:calcineurin-like phosphoesterase family protein